MDILKKKLEALGVTVKVWPIEDGLEFQSINLIFPDGANVQITSGAEGGEESWIEIDA